ncbi:MAG: AAA family ATPase [Burkholderiaceae bacterium]|nr:AAA family ATPase [Burkholderiaceae bacterium]
MIYLIGSEKGGTGKTTLATHLAAMCAVSGKEVLLVDTDKQESATFWANTRAVTRGEKNQRPDITCVTKTGKVGHDIARLAEKFDVVIVDAGGRDSVELRQAMAVCDYMLIPVRPSQYDIWSLNHMAILTQEVAEKVGTKINAHVVLNSCSTHRSVKESDEVRALLMADYASDFGLLDTQVGERIAVRRATRDGLCTVELDKAHADPKARDEMQQLYQEVFHGIRPTA